MVPGQDDVDESLQDIQQDIGNLDVNVNTGESGPLAESDGQTDSEPKQDAVNSGSEQDVGPHELVDEPAKEDENNDHSIDESKPDEGVVQSQSLEESELAPKEPEPEVESTSASGSHTKHSVQLEDWDESESGITRDSDLAAQEEAGLPIDDLNTDGQNADDDDEDFGEFDDFDEFEEAQFEEAAAPADFVETPAPIEPTHEPAATSVPFTLADMKPGVGDKLRELLGSASHAPISPSQDHLTPTSRLLWSQLVDTPDATLVDWTKSAIHRKLAVSLGVPLNLDQTLPKSEPRKMSLQSGEKRDTVDGSDVPRWHLLSIVSQEALAGMNREELEAYTSQLTAAIEGAQLHVEDLEAEEMDLTAERDVLEGMVESLLVYAQKSDRAKIGKGKKRS